MSKNKGISLFLLSFAASVFLFFFTGKTNQKGITKDYSVSVTAQQQEKHVDHDSAKENTTPKLHLLKPVTVNLPPGEKFLSIMSGNEAKSMGISFREDDLYLTTKQNLKYDYPRKITFWGPGSAPYSWEPVLYIQEH